MDSDQTSSSLRIQNGILRRSSSSSSKQKTRQSKSSITLRPSDTSSYAPQENMYPEKDSSGERQSRKKPPKVPRACECGPDFYTRVLGPTADETILTGLQAVMGLCSKLRPPHDSEEDSEIPERDRSSSDSGNTLASTSQTDGIKTTKRKNQTDSQDSSESKIQTEDSSSITFQGQTEYEMVSAGFQVNPTVKSVKTQTALFSEMVSEILQTIGLNAETASKIVQTSFMNTFKPGEENALIEPAKLASMFMQTSNLSLHSKFMQTSNQSLVPRLSTPKVESATDMQKNSEDSTTVNTAMQSDEVATATKGVMAQKNTTLQRSTVKTTNYTGDKAGKGDEHQCICPLGPQSKSKICKCCKCSSSAKLDKSSKSCMCYTKRKRSSDQSGDTMSEDKEIPEEVRYAVTKITRYKNFTAFEVLKSTQKLPSHMPSTVESVFVIRKLRDKTKKRDPGKDVKKRDPGKDAKKREPGKDAKKESTGAKKDKGRDRTPSPKVHKTK